MSLNNNRSPSLIGDLCLDLSLRGCWVIVYYPACDPGNEYDILSEKDLVDNWDVLQRGVNVSVKFGNARVQGVVVAVSDDYNYLKTNFTSLTEEHQETINDSKLNLSLSIKENSMRMGQNQKYIVKVMDKETQTNDDYIPENTKYQILQEKYDQLKNDYLKITSLFTDIKSDLKQTVLKMDNVNVIKSENILKPIENTNHITSSSSSKMIEIGSKGTQISQTVYDSINWMSYTAATRKLLITLFPRKMLATHSLTGKPSPAFQTRETKMRLNPTIISDIVEIISRKCKVSESLVRSAITTKCADENKLYRRRMEKKRGSDAENCNK